MDRAMYEIDDDVPVPMPRRWEMYPLRRMEVGQSFVVSEEKGGSLRRLAHLRGKEMGRKYVTRKIDGGVRVWRVE